MKRTSLRASRGLRVGIAALAAFAALLLGAVPAAAEDPGTGSISGTVTRQDDGTPVAGVSISAWTDDGTGFGSAMSGADGTFTVTGLAAGAYKAQYLTAPGESLVGEYYEGAHASWDAKQVLVAAGQAVAGIDASLEQGGTITGRVTRESDGAPVADRGVQVSGPSVVWTSTDANGVYTASRLLPGDYSVSFTGGDGLAGEYYDGVADSESATPVTITGSQTVAGIDATLVEGGAISGVVTRESDGAPIAGVSVSVSPVTGFGAAVVTTDENGAYRVASLFPAEYIVRFEGGDDGALAGEYWDGAHDRVDARPVLVQAGAETASIDASLQHKATISGTVTRESDDSPVAATVRIDMQMVQTDADGRFEVRVDPGAHIVEVVPEDPTLIGEYWQDTQDWNAATPITVTAGEKRDGVDFRLATAAVITGTVHMDVEMGEAAVEAWNGGEFAAVAMVGVDGSYRILVAPGTYTLKASGYVLGGGVLVPQYYDSAYSPEDATPVTVSAGSTVEGIDFDLQRGADIRGTLSTAEGGGDALQAEITAYRRNGDAWQAVRSITTGAGEYSLSGMSPVDPGGSLLPGTYTLGVKAEGYCTTFYGGTASLDTASTFVLGTGDALTGIDLALKRTCAIPGVAAGEPVIEGEPRMGQVLVAHPGTWGPTGVELRYQWLADGQPIAGAQADTLHVTGRLRGARISVVVTGSLAGYVPAEASSPVLEPAYAGPRGSAPVG